MIEGHGFGHTADLAAPFQVGIVTQSSERQGMLGQTQQKWKAQETILPADLRLKQGKKSPRANSFSNLC